MQKQRRCQSKYKYCFLGLGILLLVVGCSSKPIQEKATILENTMPSGICYDGKIYWEMPDTKQDIHTKQIGTVKKMTEDTIFPTKQGSATKNHQEYVGKPYYLNDGNVYVKEEQGYHGFHYLTSMVLGKEIAEDAILKEDSYRPHFVYKGMRYWDMDTENESIKKLPASFTEVGTIQKLYQRAVKDYSGNLEVGAKLYADTIQNRFMIVALHGEYSLYENEVYLEDYTNMKTNP